jgi:hypothetical protein
VTAGRLSHVIRSRPMARITLVLALALTIGCGKPSEVQSMSRTPCSVRGWILDVKGAKQAESPQLEIARRTELFATSSVWVEDTEYASGGIAENGAFIILDVPPRKAVIGFQATGADQARLVLDGVPEYADVLIPDVILQPGGATVRDPKAILIRVPDSDVAKVTPSGKTAKVAGYTVPILLVPFAQMGDRREYPNPGGFRPVATFK